MLASIIFVTGLPDIRSAEVQYEWIADGAALDGLRLGMMDGERGRSGRTDGVLPSPFHRQWVCDMPEVQKNTMMDFVSERWLGGGGGERGGPRRESIQQVDCEGHRYEEREREITRCSITSVVVG